MSCYAITRHSSRCVSCFASMNAALSFADLDEEFANEHVKLAQLTNKCLDGGASDLDYFILDCARVMGVKMPQGQPRTARGVLAHIFTEICHYKMR